MLMPFGRAIVEASVSSAMEVGRVEGQARRAQRDVATLEARLDRAMLACEAMWTIMRDKFGLSDDDLLDCMTRIDLQDGAQDGKKKAGPVLCPACGRTLSPRFPKCMYCGQPIAHDPFA